MEKQYESMEGMRGFLAIIRTKSTYIESRMMMNYMNEWEYERMMNESTEDHKMILDDTAFWISLEAKATDAVAKMIMDDDPVTMMKPNRILMEKIKVLHEKMWTIYKLRGYMNMYIKRNKIIKQRTTACLRSNEGMDKKCMEDKATNDQNMIMQGQKIEEAIKDMKSWKEKAIEALSVDEQNNIKKIRESIKKEYKKLCKEAMEKDEVDEDQGKSEEEKETITDEDIMMEDIDGWVDANMTGPSNKRIKKQ